MKPMFALALLVTSAILLAATCYAIGPTLFTVHLIAHDAAGRTLQATAQGNSLTYSGPNATTPSMLTLDYSTDSILCSSFGN